jgi:hypothetical protein
LKQLVDVGLLVAHGEKRGRSYAASPTLTQMVARLRESRRVEDPFGDTPAG